jgi:hypothetical protein
VVVKEKLHKHLPLSKAVQIIADQTANLGRKYDAKINRDCKNLPRLLDRKAFAIASDKITGYALEKATKEWSATKIMADDIKADQQELDFILGTECKLGCELPLRYGLPCKHWLYKAFIDDVAIPISLFHPRWLLDGPSVLHKRWIMDWDSPSNIQPDTSSSSRHAGDRYARRGEDLILEAALAAIEKHKSLPPGQAEGFALTFIKGVDKLNVAQDKLTESRRLLPAMLPEPLKEPNLRAFPTSRKRAMTGREAAEEQERDEARQRRRAQQNHDENEMWATQMVTETQLRFSQRESQGQTQLVVDTQPNTLLAARSKTPSNSSPDDSSTDSSGSATDPETDNSNPEPRRSGRVRKPSRAVASQLSQEAAAVKAKTKEKGKGKSRRKMRKSVPTSQLLEEFGIETQ